VEIHSPDTNRLDAILDAARELERELRAYVADASPTRDVESLAELAESTYAAGDPEAALELVERGLRELTSPIGRARLQHVKGKIQIRRGPALGAHELLVTEAEAIASIDPSRGSTMLADAVYAAVSAGDPQTARTTAERARELAGDPAASARADLALGAALLLGEEGREGERAIRSALDRLREAPEE
jgi:hypothetical protein